MEKSVTQHNDAATSNETSQGNSLAFSGIVTAAVFLLFAGGLYVMSLYTIAPIWFVVGLAMSIVALFVAFDIIPRFFTK